MRKILLALLVLLPATVQAQQLNSANFMFKFDLDSTTLTYCRVEGQNSNPFGSPIQSQAPVNISSAAATMTATTALTAPFLGLAVNDVIFVTYPTGVTDQKVIITFTDSDNVVVDSNFTTTLTGTSFRYMKTKCGTTVNDGWIDVSSRGQKAITFQIEQYNVTGGLDVRWECRDGAPGAQPVQVFPSCTVGACGTVQNYSGIAGITSRTHLFMAEPWASCRIGVAIHTSDDGGDLTTNTEQLTAIISLQPWN